MYGSSHLQYTECLQIKYWPQWSTIFLLCYVCACRTYSHNEWSKDNPAGLPPETWSVANHFFNVVIEFIHTWNKKTKNIISAVFIIMSLWIYMFPIWVLDVKAWHCSDTKLAAKRQKTLTVLRWRKKNPFCLAHHRTMRLRYIRRRPRRVGTSH